MTYKDNYELWSKLTFKTIEYRKNFDLMYVDENFITEYEGVVSETRINERKPPFQVGEYQFSVWNFGLARDFDVDLTEKFKEYEHEDAYEELLTILDDNLLPFNKINKLVILHTFIIHPDYRKSGITEEFFEYLYRDYISGDENYLIALVKPIQENEIDFEYFWNEKTVSFKTSNQKNAPYEEILTKDYYKLDDLIENDDTEMINYKLFSIATRCGFKRLNESHLFVFNPNKIINRLHEKRNELKELGAEDWFYDF